jgi:hypothetical protein
MKKIKIFLQAICIFSLITCAEAAINNPPAVSLTSPTTGNYKGLINIKGSATDDRGLNRIELYIDNVLVQPNMMCWGKKSCAYNVTCDSLKRSDGPHTLRLRAVDSGGKYTDSNSVSINLDNLLPTSVFLSTPVTGASVSGNVSLTANATDPSGILRVIFFRKSTNPSNPTPVVIGSDFTVPYTSTLITTNIPDGDYMLYVEAYSVLLGAQTPPVFTKSPEIMISVRNTPVDNIPPTISVTNPSNGAVVSGVVSITANASDNVAVTGVQFQVDGVNLGMEDTSAPYSASWDTAITSVSSGTHVLTAVARDAQGNGATSQSVSVTKPGRPYKTVRSYVHFGSASFSNQNILNETACFSARVNDFIAAKKSFTTSDALNSYKLPNSGVLVMQYQNGVGAEPGESSGFLDIMRDLSAIWIDEGGHEVKFRSADFLIGNLPNPVKLQHWIDLLTGLTSNYMNELASYNDGFFMDNLGGGASPDQFAVKPSNWDAGLFYDGKDAVVRALKQRFPEEKIYINGYADWSINRGEPQWTGISMLHGNLSADGMMIEEFSLGGGVTDPASPSSEARMRIRMSAALEILGLQKGLVILDYFRLDEVQKRLYCLANYLLVANEHSFYGPMIPKNDYQSSDIPEYYVDLGAPIDSVYQDLDTDPVKSGFLKRRYEKATVYSNTDDNRMFTVNLDSSNYQKLKLVGGGHFTGNGDGIWNEAPLGRVEWEDLNASRVDLGPKTAVILRRKVS